MIRTSKTSNQYEYVKRLAELQGKVDVETEVAELIVAYARLRSNRGMPVDFYSEGESSVPWDYGLEKILQANPGLDPRVQQFIVSYNREMHARGLPVFFSKQHLASRLNLTLRQLDWLAYGDSRYRTFQIPKANGEPRRIDEPVKTLKSVQRWLLRRVIEKLPVHTCSHGFRENRSILTNARKHLQRQVVVRIDLENFFPSISHKQIRRIFQKAGYPYSISNIMASLCTHKGVLPIGSPASPALSNLVCKKLDNRLWLLGRNRNFRYTRYADDLVFSSSNRRFPGMVPFLKHIIFEEGFRINERKLVVVRRDHCQKVTGIVVNRRTNVPAEQCRLIRAVLHNCRINGVDSQISAWRTRLIKLGREAPDDLDQFGRQLAGCIAFIRYVNPRKGNKLWAEYKKLSFG